jgi:hypothetical protein
MRSAYAVVLYRWVAAAAAAAAAEVRIAKQEEEEEEAGEGTGEQLDSREEYSDRR